MADGLEDLEFEEWPSHLQEWCTQEFKRRCVHSSALHSDALCLCGEYVLDEEEFSWHWLRCIRPGALRLAASAAAGPNAGLCLRIRPRGHCCVCVWGGAFLVWCSQVCGVLACQSPSPCMPQLR